MEPYINLYKRVYDWKNLVKAYKKARKGKTKKDYVIEFEKNLRENLLQLQKELIEGTYSPKPLVTFILRDPKTRKISKSEFRDRVVHHALVRIIENIFDKGFIYDSCANRTGKGNLFALERFNEFKRKVTNNGTKSCFVLKADIKHYFEEINHEILLEVVKRKINDDQVTGLIKKILENSTRSVERGGAT
jgi:retron-type reverse transcriptase